MTILDEILEHKRHEVAAARERVSADEMGRRAARCAEPTRGFRSALASAEAPAIIAEVKRRSPSRGEIRPDFDAVACASAYAEGGAAALSVLTDEYYFGGQLEFLAKIRREVSLPLLRKDFVIDPYQIDEARAAGADAVLLIVAALDPDALRALHEHAQGLGLDVLVEVHDEAELDVAMATGARLVGVNNRDLRTFEVDLGTTERLAARLAGAARRGEAPLLVAESGISSHDDLRRLSGAGAKAFLVGESLMREPDLVAALNRLRRGK